ncbi:MULTISPECIES: diguanylate cyclase [unclassified Vibrio]|uniref:diguanylate cyclase n=1 Tax=Vibrio sp. HB236076 TaxID=3232307 RepID=A0AB39HJW0_9VIBR|nr:diguanylate cyclase [Vibrio sp. HB161653]MDP5253274.1 diguanylate cyclase [Vibrio sp. HB161653]
MTINHHKVFLLFSLTALIFFVAAIETFNYKQQKYLDQQWQQTVHEQLAVVKSSIEASILRDIYLSSSLATLISSRPTISDRDLNAFTKTLVESSDGIFLVSIAKNDVINFTYPNKEAVIGTNFRNIPHLWQSVEKAKTLKKPYLAGPFDLLIGGRGVIVRIPIYKEAPSAANYWGMASAVIDFDALIQRSGIDSLAQSYPIAIKGYNSEGRTGGLIWGESDVFEHASKTETLRFPYGEWVIAIDSHHHDLVPNSEWFYYHSIRLLGYPLLLLLISAFVLIFRLYHVANTHSLQDELTGLSNRRHFIAELERRFSIAKRQNNRSHFGLINIDLNKFKSINDTYGHDVGDKALIHCAQCLQDSIRDSDIAARFGGDEFLILVNRMNYQEDMAALQKRIESKIAQTPIVDSGYSIHLTASTGSATYHHAMTDIDQLMQEADRAMYKRKSTLHDEEKKQQQSHSELTFAK